MDPGLTARCGPPPCPVGAAYREPDRDAGGGRRWRHGRAHRSPCDRHLAQRQSQARASGTGSLPPRCRRAACSGGPVVVHPLTFWGRAAGRAHRRHDPQSDAPPRCWRSRWSGSSVTDQVSGCTGLAYTAGWCCPPVGGLLLIPEGRGRVAGLAFSRKAGRGRPRWRCCSR
jgi:hypothetical protein